MFSNGKSSHPLISSPDGIPLWIAAGPDGVRSLDKPLNPWRLGFFLSEIGTAILCPISGGTTVGSAKQSGAQ